jgi:hypothetical protein
VTSRTTDPLNSSLNSSLAPARPEVSASASDRSSITAPLTRESTPREWAATQDSLGTALQILGEQTGGPSRVRQAALAYREALQERTRDRAPLEWAATQNNLGIALRTLGMQLGDPRPLEEAVASSLGGDQDAVMDRYTDVLEQLRRNDCQRLRGYASDRRSKFTTWLVVVARRLCLDQHRQRYGRDRNDPETASTRQADRSAQQLQIRRAFRQPPRLRRHDDVLIRGKTIVAKPSAVAIRMPIRAGQRNATTSPAPRRVTGHETSTPAPR